MATPYWQIFPDGVASTQDLALEALGDIPTLVISASQKQGRGRTGSQWINAPRAVAVSLAMIRDADDRRPLSLIAGVAALRVLERGTDLKWPNDVQRDGEKVGGILVEQTGDRVAIGLGLNLWWPAPPEGIAGLYLDDPGPGRHAEIGAMWGAEMQALVAGERWPLEEYRAGCSTLGQAIAWEPDGSGTALDVTEDGALVVEVGSERVEIHSGAVRHLRA